MPHRRARLPRRDRRRSRHARVGTEDRSDRSILTEQVGDTDLDGVEGLGPHDLIAARAEHDDVTFARPPVNGEGLVLWIDDPIVANAVPAIREELLPDVIFSVRRGENFADPIWPNADGPPARPFEDALASPTDDVGDVDFMGLELNLDFGADPPAAGAASASLERAP
jgi:hypothetical protein